jgi:hypothetical protein
VLHIDAGLAAGEPAPLVIRTIVSGIDEASLAGIPDVKVVGARAGGVEIETPRYDLYTRLLEQIARQGGTVVEIAGNDDIMVTLSVPEGSTISVPGTEIMRMERNGFPAERVLVDVEVKNLAALLTARPLGDPGVEHVLDY